MKASQQAAIALLLVSSVSAQSVIVDGILYWGPSSTTASVTSTNYCDNPGSVCETGTCCGIATPDSSLAANTATIPVQICYAPPTGLTSSVVLNSGTP